jgi:hypothetical protein
VGAAQCGLPADSSGRFDLAVQPPRGAGRSETGVETSCLGKHTDSRRDAQQSCTAAASARYAIQSSFIPRRVAKAQQWSVLRIQSGRQVHDSLSADGGRGCVVGASTSQTNPRHEWTVRALRSPVPTRQLCLLPVRLIQAPGGGKPGRVEHARYTRCRGKANSRRARVGCGPP